MCGSMPSRSRANDMTWWQITMIFVLVPAALGIGIYVWSLVETYLNSSNR